jgi:PucR C-terminal helix-turn-helix domain
LARVLSVPDPSDESTIEPHAAIRAIGLALEFVLECVVDARTTWPSPPTKLLHLVRSAARDDVRRNTILRRYVAGQAVFVDFLVEEAEAAGLDGKEIQAMLQSQSVLSEQLLATIGQEYDRAQQGLPAIATDRLETVRRMLAEENVDSSKIPYDFGANHLGVVAVGPGAREAISALRSGVDCVLLAVENSDGAIWAWLGGRRALDPREVEQGSSVAPAVALAFGEPARGPRGWRLTHRQAQAAMMVAQPSSTAATHYADVALLATIANDEVLADSLRELYLAPLQGDRDGGDAARATLRAYFAAQRNVSATAATLGVSRRTVTARLQAIEARLGRYLSTCTVELEAALRLDDFDGARRQSESTN